MNGITVMIVNQTMTSYKQHIYNTIAKIEVERQISKIYFPVYLKGTADEVYRTATEMLYKLAESIDTCTCKEEPF
jgi:hypothetical protein